MLTLEDLKNYQRQKRPSGSPPPVKKEERPLTEHEVVTRMYENMPEQEYGMIYSAVHRFLRCPERQRRSVVWPANIRLYAKYPPPKKQPKWVWQKARDFDYQAKDFDHDWWQPYPDGA